MLAFCLLLGAGILFESALVNVFLSEKGLGTSDTLCWKKIKGQANER